ncbi:hypothetical protein ACVCL3_15990 [Rhodanobacter sp. UC4437_H4]
MSGRVKLIEELPADFSFHVPGMGCGLRLEGATAVRSISVNGHIFVRSASGVIYCATRRSGMNLSGRFNLNDHDRRAWCRLAGVRFSALKKAIARERDREKKESKRHEIEGFRKKAERLGFRLVKPRVAKA